MEFQRVSSDASKDWTFLCCSTDKILMEYYEMNRINALMTTQNFVLPFLFSSFPL